MLACGVALNIYVTNLGRYDQVYGQLGAVVVLMLWLRAARTGGVARVPVVELGSR